MFSEPAKKPFNMPQTCRFRTHLWSACRRTSHPLRQSKLFGSIEALYPPLFAGKGAMDIDGLGEKIVEQLVANGLIQDVANVYRLKVDDLIPLERFRKSQHKILWLQIQASKSPSLGRLIYALGIRFFVGRPP